VLRSDAVAVGVAVDVWVGLGVAEGVAVAVDVAVDEGLAVGVLVGTAVAVRIGVDVALHCLPLQAAAGAAWSAEVMLNALTSATTGSRCHDLRRLIRSPLQLIPLVASTPRLKRQHTTGHRQRQPCKW
jgi:hypothetical protein